MIIDSVLYAALLVERSRRENAATELKNLSDKSEGLITTYSDTSKSEVERNQARGELSRARYTAAYLRLSNLVLGAYNIAAYPAGWVLDRVKSSIGFEAGAGQWWARESTFDRGFKLARVAAFAAVAGGAIAATPVAASAATSLLAGELIAGGYKYLTGNRSTKTAGEERESLPSRIWQRLTGMSAPYLPTVPRPASAPASAPASTST